jgi:DNA-binding MarR family transcriptional regulator
VSCVPTDDATVTAAIASMARMFEVVLEQQGLTIQKYRVLKYLADEPLAPSDLAYRLTVRPPTVTRLVDGVVRLGLATRSVDGVDRRRSTIGLTAAGRRAIRQADAGIRDALDRIAVELPDRERAAADRGLELWGRAMLRYWARTHPGA